MLGINPNKPKGMAKKVINKSDIYIYLIAFLTILNELI